MSDSTRFRVDLTLYLNAADGDLVEVVVSGALDALRSSVRDVLPDSVPALWVSTVDPSDCLHRVETHVYPDDEDHPGGDAILRACHDCGAHLGTLREGVR